MFGEGCAKTAGAGGAATTAIGAVTIGRRGAAGMRGSGGGALLGGAGARPPGVQRASSLAARSASRQPTTRPP